MPSYLLETIMVQSIKISDELMDEVRREAKLQDRTLAAQVEHWVHIGMAIERSGNFSYDRINAVLSAEARSSTPNDAEYTAWSDRFIELMSKPGPNEEAFFAERRRLGLGVGLDENGNLVRAADLKKADEKG